LSSEKTAILPVLWAFRGRSPAATDARSGGRCKRVPAPGVAPSVPTLVIQPTRGWGSLGLAELWEYRDLLRFHVWRNVKGKYRQMALGPTWIVLQPLFSMAVFTFVFGQVARLPSEGVPYPIFTYTALLP